MQANSTPSIIRVKTTRENAVVFAINGPLATTDIEDVYNILSNFIPKNKSIHFMLIFHAHTTIDWGTLFNPDTAGFRAKKLKGIKKYAIIGGPDWIPLAFNFFQPFGAIEAKWFTMEQLEQGWNFIDARPQDEQP